jgi:hemolysin type calcium-binding protein
VKRLLIALITIGIVGLAIPAHAVAASPDLTVYRADGTEVEWRDNWNGQPWDVVVTSYDAALDTEVAHLTIVPDMNGPIWYSCVPTYAATNPISLATWDSFDGVAGVPHDITVYPNFYRDNASVCTIHYAGRSGASNPPYNAGYLRYVVSVEEAVYQACPLADYQYFPGDDPPPVYAYLYPKNPVVDLTGLSAPGRGLMVCVLGSDQTIISGSGSEAVFIPESAANTTVTLGSGTDVVYTWASGITVQGQGGLDQVNDLAGTGFTFAKPAAGLAARAVAASAPTRIYGGRGNDTLKADSGNRLVYGGPGSDHIRATRVSDEVYGGAGYDTCTVKRHAIVRGCEKVRYF